MIAASFDWANLGIAGAFVVGSIFGTIATLRIVKYVTAYFVNVPRRGPPDHDDREDHNRVI